MAKIARYQQIINDLAHQIAIGKYRVNDKLPTEAQLALDYCVSRMTVNKALSQMENKDLIYKVQGSGTFVKESTIHKQFGSSVSFSSDVNLKGEKPGSLLLQYRLLDPQSFPAIASKLCIPMDNEIIYFERLRTADDTRVAISHTYIATNVVPSVALDELNRSFYAFLEKKYDIKPQCTNYEVAATIPTKEQAKLLEISNEALLKVSHTSFTHNEVPIEYNETYYLGSKFTYTTKNDCIKLR